MRYPQGGGLTAERQQFREELRLKAAERFARGEASSVIAKDLRVSMRSVQRWRRMWDKDGPRALRSQGPASLPRLSEKQFAQTGGRAGQGPGCARLGRPTLKWGRPCPLHLAGSPPMSSDRWSTHTIEMGPDCVIKRFRDTDRERCEREWRALRLLDTYVPGLAPRPKPADPAAAVSTVVMSRLIGRPLRGRPIDERQTKALAETVAALHSAVPPSALAEVPLRPGRQGELIAHIDAWSARTHARASSPVSRAMAAGLAWLAKSGLDPSGEPSVPTVFGPGDGNLANYLWDGSKVRVVDFEDSGRSDRAFELAEITEHVSSWVDHPLDVPAFLGHFDLTPAEASRLRECRRLLALVWLFLLSFDDPDHPRNPPGTTDRQADRLLELLD